jgi:hypothetical protein
MRKIVSKEKRDQASKRNLLIIGGILIFIMLFSIFSFGLSGSGFGGSGNSGNGNGQSDGATRIQHNGFEFVTAGGIWGTEINGNDHIFENGPAEVGVLGPESGLSDSSSYTDKPLYIYSEDELSELEVYANMFPIVDGIHNACPEGNSGCNSFETRTCEDNFIIIEASDSESSVTQNGNCVFIKGSSEELISLSDSFLYDILGVN